MPNPLTQRFFAVDPGEKHNIGGICTGERSLSRAYYSKRMLKDHGLHATRRSLCKRIEGKQISGFSRLCALDTGTVFFSQSACQSLGTAFFAMHK